MVPEPSLRDISLQKTPECGIALAYQLDFCRTAAVMQKIEFKRLSSTVVLVAVRVA
jgi:hypothetical protein